MGGPISWARMHRWHHRYSDTNEDPHTPKKGIITAYYKWLLDPPNVPPFVIKDYLKDSKLIFIEKHSKKIVLLTLILIFSVNYTIGLSFMLAMVLTFHSEMFINAFMHKDIKGKFTAINSVILAPFSGGSTLHKNHHDSPGSPNFSTKWYEIDATYYIILMLKK
jgi:stearoyl-CoA desaturase (delta-9 desaturase)